MHYIIIHGDDDKTRMYVSDGKGSWNKMGIGYYGDWTFHDNIGDETMQAILNDPTNIIFVPKGR